MELMKTCSKCKLEKPLSDFCADKKSSSRQSQCKECKKNWATQYRDSAKGKQRISQFWSKYIGSPKDKKRRMRYYEKHKLSMNMSRRIRQSLNADKNGRSWELVVGYSTKELQEHLEKLFTKGMTWDNYGEWEIDHIEPVSSFRIKDIHSKGFKECWTLSNLQPLWKRDNMKKSNKN